MAESDAQNRRVSMWICVARVNWICSRVALIVPVPVVMIQAIRMGTITF